MTLDYNKVRMIVPFFQNASSISPSFILSIAPTDDYIYNQTFLTLNLLKIIECSIHLLPNITVTF